MKKNITKKSKVKKMTSHKSRGTARYSIVSSSSSWSGAEIDCWNKIGQGRVPLKRQEGESRPFAPTRGNLSLSPLSLAQTAERRKSGQKFVNSVTVTTVCVYLCLHLQLFFFKIFGNEVTHLALCSQNDKEQCVFPLFRIAMQHKCLQADIGTKRKEGRFPRLRMGLFAGLRLL